MEEVKKQENLKQTVNQLFPYVKSRVHQHNMTVAMLQNILAQLKALPADGGRNLAIKNFETRLNTLVGNGAGPDAQTTVAMAMLMQKYSGLIEEPKEVKGGDPDGDPDGNEAPPADPEGKAEPAPDADKAPEEAAGEPEVADEAEPQDDTASEDTDDEAAPVEIEDDLDDNPDKVE